jgi:hypothetical protein
LQKARESGLFKVMIGGEGFTIHVHLHEKKTNSVTERPWFVSVLNQIIKRFVVQNSVNDDYFAVQP